MVDAEKKLESLLEKEKQLKKQIASEKAKIKAKNRKDETRKKILVGSFFLERTAPADIQKYMNEYLKRPNDRALFGLDEVSNQNDTINQGESNDQGTGIQS